MGEVSVGARENAAFQRSVRAGQCRLFSVLMVLIDFFLHAFFRAFYGCPASVSVQVRFYLGMKGRRVPESEVREFKGFSYSEIMFFLLKRTFSGEAAVGYH